MTFDAHPRSSLIVALDFDSLSSAVKFAKQVADLVGLFKIGNQLFTAAGPAGVKEIAALGPGIFLDLKFHDIPNTVAGAVLSAAAMNGVQLVNVHALGGSGGWVNFWSSRVWLWFFESRHPSLWKQLIQNPTGGCLDHGKGLGQHLFVAV